MKRITLSVAISQIETQKLIIKNLTKKLENCEKELSQVRMKQAQGATDNNERVTKAVAMIKGIRDKTVKRISRVAMSEKFGLTLGSINYWCVKVSNNEA
tara:strand:+ start:6844 stop:7140 length:297 start_codon:yes stop_codon:yes gene_type:complete